MADETRVLTTPPGESLRLSLAGPDAECPPPIPHAGRLVHEARPGAAPFMHMVCWDEDDTCNVEHTGVVTHVGDAERPIPLQMRHSGEAPIELRVHLDDTEHGLRVRTGRADPIHHALQLHSPLVVRFADQWTASSDYRIAIQLRQQPFLDIRITGRTTLTPTPVLGECGDAPRVHTMVDLLGRSDS